MACSSRVGRGGKGRVTTMRRAASWLATTAFAVAAISVTSATAQDAPQDQDQDLPAIDLSVTVKVTPSRAGTKQSPQGLLLGPGFSSNGGTYVTCSKRVLDREGLEGCPDESIMGSASTIAAARAGTGDTKLDITFVNGDAQQLLAYVRFEYPARAQETIAAKANAMNGNWRYKYTPQIPESLQVIAGVPIHTTGVQLELGGKPHAKSSIATTYCPKGGWKYHVTTHYRYDLTNLTDHDAIKGTILCTG
jgi:hypothetical protein